MRTRPIPKLDRSLDRYGWTSLKRYHHLGTLSIVVPYGQSIRRCCFQCQRQRACRLARTPAAFGCPVRRLLVRHSPNYTCLRIPALDCSPSSHRPGAPVMIHPAALRLQVIITTSHNVPRAVGILTRRPPPTTQKTSVPVFLFLFCDVYPVRCAQSGAPDPKRARGSARILGACRPLGSALAACAWRDRRCLAA